MSIRYAHFTKIVRIVPFTVLVSAAAVVWFAQQTPVHKVSAVADLGPTTSPSVTEIPASNTQVSVNGQPLSVDHNGSADVVVPSAGSSAHVSVSEHGKTVTTTVEPKSGSASSDNSGTLNLSVNSSSNGGNSWGSTFVSGTSFSSSNNGAAAGFNSTQVFSTDSENNVNVIP